MMNWQQWAVAILLLLCIVRIGWGIYAFFRRTKENGNPCANCVTGCDLKRLMDEKRAECSATKKEKKKKSFIFDQVMKAATALTNAVSNLDDSMSKEGIGKQIENIEGA